MSYFLFDSFLLEIREKTIEEEEEEEEHKSKKRIKKQQVRHNNNNKDIVSKGPNEINLRRHFYAHLLCSKPPDKIMFAIKAPVVSVVASARATQKAEKKVA